MINCPYCDIEISMSQVDAHDGCCPECGGYISAMSSFEDDDFGGMYDDEEDEEFEDDYDDEFDDLDNIEDEINDEDDLDTRF